MSSKFVEPADFSNCGDSFSGGYGTEGGTDSGDYQDSDSSGDPQEEIPTVPDLPASEWGK